MKCIKCGTKNVHNANYCKKCAYEFSLVEQKAAEKWTLIGIVKRIEDLKEKITFGWLFDNLIFKIIFVLVVLLIGLIFVFNNGFEFKLLENDSYSIKYNEELEEYYLLTKEDKVDLSMYIPKDIDKFNVKLYDNNNIMLSDLDYKVDDNIVLFSNDNLSYYVLEVKYDDDNSDILKLFVYLDKDGE